MDWWPGRSAVPHEMPARQAYDAWASEYPAEAHNPLMHAEEEAMILRLQSPQHSLQGRKPLQVLDAGAGTGRYTRILRAMGARTVISLDWSREMLGRQAGDAERVCGDARRLPFAGGAFDLVNASLMAGDISNLAAWLSEMARVLSPGGRVIYSDFHPAWHERGWRRTFQDNLGRTIALPCHAHSLDEHRVALADSGLCVEAIDEVSVAPQLNALNRWRPGARSSVPALVVVSAARMAGAHP
ncbi:MAG TPA: class I SAM-dependent methyltransferase [Vicinamibacterales bacterium]|nr:class I SAM-dependent methyltransferase [Vicinamibacterales bacterium]